MLNTQTFYKRRLKDMASITMVKQMPSKPPSAGLRKKGLFHGYIKHKWLFLMLIPVLAYYIIFKYIPMYGIIISFQDFYPLKGIGGSEWVGFKHFIELFESPLFLRAMGNTLIISFFKLVVGFPAPIILAILINEVRHVKFKKLVQSVSYLPHFISWIVLSGIVVEFLSPSRGALNIVLQAFGLEPIFFMADPQYFRGVLVISDVWRGIGWSSIVYLAAVTNVDPQLYEAADMDGASRLRKIWHITIPSLIPVITIMFIFAVGKLITDDFDQIFNLLNSKVMEVGDVLGTYTYREGLERMNYSYSTAVGLFKNAISFALIFFTNWIARKSGEYAIW